MFQKNALCRLFYSCYSTRSKALSSKLQAALRPFIFSVHPDLFGQFPLQKRVNEESLKILNEYIQRSENFGVVKHGDDVITLKFFQRIDNDVDRLGRSSGDLKMIYVELHNDILKSIKQILTSNDLPIEIIDELLDNQSSNSKQGPDRPIDWMQSQYYSATGRKYPFDVWDEINKLKPAATLHRWMKANINNARLLESKSMNLRRDYLFMQRKIIEEFGLNDIRWSCGWRGTHQLASLKSLSKLLNVDKEVQAIVKGRKIIFGNEGGVTLNGDIVLNSEETAQQWSKAFTYVPLSDKYLTLIPHAEMQLSHLLNDIKIVRRKTPPVPHAHVYYNSLASLISRFGMAYEMVSNRRLNCLELVVSGSISDELTLTPEGHINVPSHSPVWAIKNFIRDNQNSALELKSKYMRDKDKAEQLKLLVVETFRLQNLTAENNISYHQLIQCCNNLLSCQDSLKDLLVGIRLCIAPYFSVMNDGEMYVLWNWVSE